MTPVEITKHRENMRLAYKDALTVQDACNLSGVVYAFARHMETLCADGLDTDARNLHPVSVLFASKIASLTRSEIGGVFEAAQEDCENRAAS